MATTFIQILKLFVRIKGTSKGENIAYILTLPDVLFISLLHLFSKVRISVKSINLLHNSGKHPVRKGLLPTFIFV